VNLGTGFITFADRPSAEVALRLTAIPADKEELTIETAPEPDDILWSDFTQDPTAAATRMWTGYACTVGLAMAYMPIVTWLSGEASKLNLGPLNILWQAVAPTAGLDFMVCLLPTFLIMIFVNFFTTYAKTYMQHKLQVWYFWFQVAFVLLIVAVGQNVSGFAKTIVDDPLAIFTLFANSMPNATHYYMNYIVMQILSQTLVFTRYVPLTKYKMWSQILDEKDAKKKAEPENQDYYGMGSRCARFTTFGLIALVYGTMCPPINMLCLLLFTYQRKMYSYLLVFAETKKADLGGVFWIDIMHQMYWGLLIYTFLMVGIYYERAPSIMATIISAPSIVFVLWAKKRFDNAFAWETLPFKEIHDEATEKMVTRTLTGEYMQPELSKS
jgi:hypothetical protein